MAVASDESSSVIDVRNRRQPCTGSNNSPCLSLPFFLNLFISPPATVQGLHRHASACACACSSLIVGVSKNERRQDNKHGENEKGDEEIYS